MQFFEKKNREIFMPRDFYAIKYVNITNGVVGVLVE